MRCTCAYTLVVADNYYSFWKAATPSPSRCKICVTLSTLFVAVLDVVNECFAVLVQVHLPAHAARLAVPLCHSRTGWIWHPKYVRQGTQHVFLLLLCRWYLPAHEARHTLPLHFDYAAGPAAIVVWALLLQHTSAAVAAAVAAAPAGGTFQHTKPATRYLCTLTTQQAQQQQ
jgi:hypothetical protein